METDRKLPGTKVRVTDDDDDVCKFDGTDVTAGKFRPETFCINRHNED